MKEVKVSELQGLALDYAVAEAIGWKEPFHGVGDISYWAEERHGVKEQYLMVEAPDPDEPDEVTEKHHFNHLDTWAPSRFWSQGGPLIERHNIWLGAPIMDRKRWDASVDISVDQEIGDTPLIAACRAIVAAKLGDVASIPDELME